MREAEEIKTPIDSAYASRMTASTDTGNGNVIILRLCVIGDMSP